MGAFWIILPNKARASRGNKPPGSGQPVPGTKPASMQSISKLIQTQSVPSKARSKANSAAASMPRSTMSVTVKILVARSRQTLTP